MAYPYLSWIPAAPADVAIYITELLDIHDLVRVRMTWSNGDRYVSAVLCRRMRMALHPYFHRYKDFVQEMRFTGAVIGDQMALNVLHPALYQPAHLTIFLPNRLFFHMLGYLITAEGYAAVLATTRDARTLQKRTCTGTLSRGDHCIVLIQSTTESSLYALHGTSNTAKSAYFSPTSFCDPYPLLNRARIALIDPRQTFRQGCVRWPGREDMTIWRQLGWTVAVHGGELEHRGPCHPEPRPDCAAALRYFGDRHCAAGPLLPLRGRPVLMPTLRGPALEDYTVVWWRGGRVCGRGCLGNLTRVEPGANTVLRRVVSGL